MFGHRGLACDGQVNAEQAAQRGTPMHMSNESLLVILLVGLIAGWLAGKIVQGTGLGIVGDLIVGIVGAFIGSWLLPQLGIHWLGHYCSDHQRHHRRADTVADHQARSWRRRMARELAEMTKMVEHEIHAIVLCSSFTTSRR